MGNHDTEIGSKLNRTELGKEFRKGEYSIFAHGPKNVFGVGNFFIHLVRPEDWNKPQSNGYCRTPMVLTMLDSNMYGEGWFFTGFDRIHEDQAQWCMDRLDWLREPEKKEVQEEVPKAEKPGKTKKKPEQAPQQAKAADVLWQNLHKKKRL